MRAEDMDEIVMTNEQASKSRQPSAQVQDGHTPGMDSKRGSTSGLAGHRKLKGQEQEEAMRELLSKR